MDRTKAVMSVFPCFKLNVTVTSILVLVLKNS